MRAGVDLAGETVRRGLGGRARPPRGSRGVRLTSADGAAEGAVADGPEAAGAGPGAGSRAGVGVGTGTGRGGGVEVGPGVDVGSGAPGGATGVCAAGGGGGDAGALAPRQAAVATGRAPRRRCSGSCSPGVASGSEEEKEKDVEERAGGDAGGLRV